MTVNKDGYQSSRLVCVSATKGGMEKAGGGGRGLWELAGRQEH